MKKLPRCVCSGVIYYFDGAGVHPPQSICGKCSKRYTHEQWVKMKEKIK